MKKEYNNLANIILICSLVVILIIVISTLFICYQMPKQVCHLEQESDVIILGDKFAIINKPEMHQRYITDKAEYMCSNEIRIDDLRNINSIWFVGINTTCILKNYKEVCEVVYK